MHFIPYAYLPENHKDFPSLWVDFPNKYYDPKRGHKLYQQYISELVLVDRLGFDAVVVNEHHNTAYSMMAIPSLIAATVIPQINRAKICVWGTPPNLEYPNPATARERHEESINIILQAWKEDGPTTYYGDFYTYRYLN